MAVSRFGAFLRSLFLAGLFIGVAGFHADSLQVSFPMEAGSAEQTARSISLKARSLKEYFDRFQMSYGGDVYRTATYGDKTRAFRPDDTYYQNLFGILATKKLKNGAKFETNMSVRHNTDPVISTKDNVHITSFYASAEKEKEWGMRAGDLYPNLSRYSFSRSAEGFLGSWEREAGSLRWIGPARFRAQGVVGTTQRARENSTLRRGASGAALTLESDERVGFKPKWFTGYRFAHAADKLGSVDNHGSLADLHIGTNSVVYGLNLASGWTVDGENAWSSGAANKKTETFNRHGYAWMTNINWLKDYRSKPYEGLWKLRPFAFSFNWELTDPYFQTALGVAAPDQRRWNVRTAHRWNENFDWTISHLKLENNVRNQNAVTTASRTTTLGFNVNPFKLLDPNNSSWLRLVPESIRDIKGRGEFRFALRDASDGSVNQKIEDYVYSATYTNWGVTFRNDFTFQITDDDATPTNERRVQAWGINMTRPFHWKSWDLRLFPNIRYRESRDKFRLTGAYTRLQTTSLGLGANWEEIAGNFNWMILDSNREPSGSDYLQNQLTSSLTYRPYLFPGFQGTLYYSYGDVNDEFLPRSYRQTETKMSVKYVF